MFITPAFAQAAGATDTNNLLMSLLPFALIFIIMYFLILRPQQKKAKEHNELVKNIRRGDTVITTSGLVGKVTKVVDDDQIEFEIADGVRVRQMRQMISIVRAKGEPAKANRLKVNRQRAPLKEMAPRTTPPRAKWPGRSFLESDELSRCCILHGGRRWRSS